MAEGGNGLVLRDCKGTVQAGRITQNIWAFGLRRQTVLYFSVFFCNPGCGVFKCVLPFSSARSVRGYVEVQGEV